MPELPEVETVVRWLRPQIVGRVVTGVTVSWSRSVATGSAELKRALPGQRITGLGRRGKYLVFALASGQALLVHLRMTGSLALVAGDAPAGRFTRVAFTLDDRRVLRFEDARKFGRVYLAPRAEQITAALGPEPLEETFTVQQLAVRLAGRGRQLKPLLLDQAFLAGLGNIYVDESLNLAGLHPLRRADALGPAEIRRLHRAIRKTLAAAIEHNGTTFDWAYAGGGYQRRLRVYDRAGQPCPRCGTAIVHTVVGQRSTYYCPRCQRLEANRDPDEE